MYQRGNEQLGLQKGRNVVGILLYIEKQTTESNIMNIFLLLLFIIIKLQACQILKCIWARIQGVDSMLQGLRAGVSRGHVRYTNR
jgi:hypothetical protein